MAHGWNATGRARCSSARCLARFPIALPHTDLHTDDGQSYLEEPPETPAPLFAVRAFKTAIFGTPHPNQNDDLNDEKRLGQSRAVKAKEPIPQQRTPHGTAPSLGLSTELDCKEKIEPLTSPAKGILLTPGTAATKRKTVSFGGLANNSADKTKRKLDETNARVDASSNDQGFLAPEVLRSESKNQSSLTKTLFKAQLEASKKKLSTEASQEKSEARALLLTSKDTMAVGTTSWEEVPDLAVDTTIDLSQPRSRSGQHWKAEYEQYHKNSAREMKKIIKYGQNVKSYALKKDSEATSLGEKLKQELSKLAAMEAKVSKLATQLATGRQGGPSGDADQIELVSDLAKQTALAIRYKQKADMYRKAIETNHSADLHGLGQDDSRVEQEGQNLSPTHLSKKQELNETPKELVLLRTELETFKENVKFTEEKAARLEAENMTLKRSLARVKEEMNSYEKRRLAREQRLKTREVRLQQEKQEYERRLAETTREYQRLLCRHDQHFEKSDVDNHLPKHDINDGGAFRHVEVEFREEDVAPKEVGPSDACHMEVALEPPKRQEHKDSVSPKSHNIQERQLTSSSRDTVVASPKDAKNNAFKLPKHDHKHTVPISNVDLWMMGSPGDAVPNTSLSKGLAQSSHFDLLRKETNHALLELDQNSVSESPVNHQVPFGHLEESIHDTNVSPRPAKMDSSVLPSMSSAVRRMHQRRLNMGSPRPSIVNFASGPPQQAPSSASIPPANASKGRNSLVTGPREQRYSSIVSSSTRTSTMASARRHSALPADRAAAAKARLQRRSMEKQKLLERSKENAQP